MSTAMITRASRLLSVSMAAVALAAAPVFFETVLPHFDFGASAEAQAKQQQTRRLPGISESVMKKLGVVTEHVSPDTEKNPGKKPNFQEAIKELGKMERSCREKCNKYEISQIHRFYAFAYYSMDNYPKAIQAYKKVIAQSPEIPIAVELDALNALSQLSYAQENYNDALKYLTAWMNLSTIVGADKFMLRAQIHYSKGDKASAIKDANNAISMTEKAGKVPNEQWYGFQNSLYLEREDYKTSHKVLEKLLAHYAKPKYWTQYANVNGLLGRDKDQMHSLDAVHLSKALTSRQDIVNLAYLYLGEEVPHKAAKILEGGMKDKIVDRNVKYLKTLGGAWRAAREYDKAATILTEAAKVADKEDAANRGSSSYKPEEGNIYADLVGVYQELDKPKDAVEAGKKALAAGNLRRACEVHTNMGIAYVDMAQYKSAIASFEKAQVDKQCRAIVINWIQYAQNEQRQKEELAKSI